MINKLLKIFSLLSFMSSVFVFSKAGTASKRITGTISEKSNGFTRSALVTLISNTGKIASALRSISASSWSAIKQLIIGVEDYPPFFRNVYSAFVELDTVDGPFTSVDSILINKNK
ncbi:hypothetical protein SAMN05421847_1878 [Halpernia humi]|uniref:Uncharacterized protein n=1 Tax=Halpernia humi TaxID=493375 RepID=A0A1H5YX43_9FLAO|nr:hypothetical protein [Halpernia humi]SEG28005.1 hypothetical protein SAMN05421847_1878 [Halpernia humi]